MENKKGQVQIYFSLGVISLLILSVFVAFFSNKFRFFAIGLVLSIMAFVVLFKANFIEKSNIRVALFIVLLGVGLVMIFSLNILQQSFQDGYIEVPFYGTIECSRASGENSVFGPSLSIAGRFITAPENLDKYDVLLDYPDVKITQTDRRVEYYTCADTQFNDCNSPNYYSNDKLRNGPTDDAILISGVPRGRVVYVEAQKLGLTGWSTVSEGGSIKIRYIPYVLWVDDALGGGRNQISGSTDCRYPTGDLKNKAIVSTTISKDKDGNSFKSPINIYKNDLQPSETYNYISGFLTAPSEGNVIKYNNEEGYCIQNVQGKGAVIYEIGQIKTVSKTYNVVDTNNAITNLGFDGCCELGQVQGNRVCEDFKWITLETDDDSGETNVECSIFEPCNDGRFPLGEGTKTYEFDCVQNKCVVSNIQEEECIETSQCQGNNEICVNYECIESSTFPDEESEKTCGFFEESVTITEEIGRGPFGIGSLIGLTKIVETQECRVKQGVLWSILAIIILLLGGFALYLLKPTKRRRRR